MTAKIRKADLMERVQLRVQRVCLSPLFDDPAYIEKQVKTAILELFKELHLEDRFLRPGYVPAFDIETTGPEDVHVHFKDEDIEFLFTDPTDLQKEILKAQHGIAESTAVPKHLLN